LLLIAAIVRRPMAETHPIPDQRRPCGVGGTDWNLRPSRHL